MKKNNEKGIIIVLAVIFSFVFTLFSLVIVYITGSEVLAVKRQRDRLMALYMADSGVEKVRSWIDTFRSTITIEGYMTYPPSAYLNVPLRPYTVSGATGPVKTVTEFPSNQWKQSSYNVYYMITSSAPAGNLPRTYTIVSQGVCGWEHKTVKYYVKSSTTGPPLTYSCKRREYPFVRKSP